MILQQRDRALRLVAAQGLMPQFRQCGAGLRQDARVVLDQQDA